MPVVQFAAPHGSLPGTQEAMRPPWLAVAPKKAVRAATAPHAPLITTAEVTKGSWDTPADFKYEPMIECVAQGRPRDMLSGSCPPSAASVAFCTQSVPVACRMSKHDICIHFLKDIKNCSSTAPR